MDARGWFGFARAALASSALWVTAVGCNGPRMDLSAPSGKVAIVEQVTKLLSSQQCQAAIALIEPVYNSSYTDNDVRMVRSAAHACFAGLNFFGLLGDFTTINMSATDAFWQFMTEAFYPTGYAGAARTSILDNRIQSSFYAMDALMSAIPSGRTINEDVRFNPATVSTDVFNLGSLRYSDRTNDANLYLFFVAMAVMGNIQNQYGNPDASYDRQTALPWVTSALMDTAGCGYASAMTGFFDAATVMNNVAGTQVKAILSQITGLLSPLIDTACSNGCAGMDWDGTPGVEAACTYACTSCPLKLRYRGNCATDAESACAAAGIIRFMNSPLGWT